MNAGSWNSDLSMGRFDARGQRWTYAHPVPGRERRDRLVLATFNVWFGTYYADLRYQAIANLLRREEPDLIALQEIIPYSLSMLLDNPWIRQNYAVSDIDGSTFGDYGVVLLSRLPVDRLIQLRLPSRMGRTLLVAELTVDAHPLSVATVHLESLRHSSQLRGAQLELIFETLADADNAIIMGDFNFCASWRDENDRLSPAYRDLWPLIHGDAAGFTEDTSVNTMRHLVSGKDKHVRFDRILLKSAPSQRVWDATSIKLIGTEPIRPDLPEVFPSDHFGLVAEISPRGPLDRPA